MKLLINLFFSIFLFLNTWSCFIQATETSSLKQILSDLKQNQSPEVIKMLEEAEEKASELEGEANKKIQELQTHATYEIKKINDSLEKKVEKIQQEAARNILQAKKSAQKEFAKASKGAQNHVEEINNKFKAKILNLKKNATLKILDLINNADEEALKIRKLERKRDILSDLQQPITIIPSIDLLAAPSQSLNFIEVTEDWKNSIVQEFEENSSLLQRIIIDGENQEQIQDFMERFEQQKNWFDKTLGATKYISDQNYNKILNKNAQIDQVATAIRKSNSILKNLDLNSEQKKQILLNVLYEINVLPKPISNDMIQQVTFKLIEKVSDKFILTPESISPKIQYTQTFENLGKEMLDLQLTNKELLNKFEQNQKTTSELNSQLIEMKKQSNEAANKVDLIGQVCSLKIQEQTELLKSTTYSNEKPLTPDLINKKTEEENKQKLELEIELLEKIK